MAKMLDQRVRDLEGERDHLWDELSAVRERIAHIADGLASTLIRAKGLRLAALAATPSAPEQSSDGALYIKGGKLVVQYDDGGTVRYKYLDLTGTGVTWVHTAVAP